MKERPILFNPDMVKALAAGWKWQTRRAIKLFYKKDRSGMYDFYRRAGKDFKGENWQGAYEPQAGTFNLTCPYGQISDELWVKEAHYLYGQWHIKGVTKKTKKEKWRFIPDRDKGVKFPDDPPELIAPGTAYKGWFKRNSLFMPRWASRTQLNISKIRLQNVQEINFTDASAEGLYREYDGTKYWYSPSERRNVVVNYRTDTMTPYPEKAFEALWDGINKKQGFGWDVDPLVWVVEFFKVKK